MVPILPIAPPRVQKLTAKAPVWVRESFRFGKQLHRPGTSRFLRPNATRPNHSYKETLQHAQTLQPFEFHANHIFDSNCKKEIIDTLLTGMDSATWTQALSNEYGRLAQGIDDRVVATDTIDFIHKSEVPSNKTVTYGNYVCDYRPLKSEPY
jgi:hypothetical protein